MVYIKKYINIQRTLFPYVGLEDKFENGQDTVFLELLKQSIELQNKIAIRLEMKIIIPPEPYTMFNLNEIISAINDNFALIEEKLNQQDTQIDMVNFDSFKEYIMFFSSYNKTVDLKINNDTITLKTEKNKYTFSLENETIEKSN